MPYDPISPMSRRGEKIAPFLTTQHVMGMIVLAAPTYTLCAPLPPTLRFVVTLLMVVLAYVLTSESRGMAPYERALWRLRGRARGLLRGTTISPAMLPDVVAQVRVPVSRQGAAVRLAPGAPLGADHAAGGSPRSALPASPTHMKGVADAHP